MGNTLITISRQHGSGGTKVAQIYDKANHENLEISYPTDKQCREISSMIYRIKDTSNIDYQEVALQLSELMEQIGNYTFILACTELSILDKSLLGEACVVDAMDILAMVLVNKSGYDIGMLHEGYDEKIIRMM